MNEQLELLNEASRQSLVTFVERAMPQMIPDYMQFPYVAFISALFEQIILGKRRGRLVVNLPPRHGKSFVLIATIAWYLGKYPEREVILMTYSQSLANDHASKVANLIRSPFFKAIFPNFEFREGRETMADFRTTRGGGFKAGGFDTGITGRGMHLLLIDDALSAQDARSQIAREKVRAIFENTLVTRANDPMTASIISLSHRVHEDDLTSHLVKQGFRHIVLPFEATQDERWECNGEIYIRSAGDILQPGRWPPDFKGALLTHIYLTQYQQAPTAIGSGILTRDHFPIAQACPSGGQVIVSWDIASSKREGSSYSVGLAFRVVENAAYLIKIIRGRFDYTKLRDLAQDIDTMYGPLHLIEATSLGVALSDDLIKAGANVLPIKVGSASKEQRLEAVINKIEIRFVRPILDIENLEDFYNEITSFPNGKHNDCVDALTQLLNWLRENPPSPRRPLVTLGAGKIRGFHPNPAESRTSRGRRF